MSKGSLQTVPLQCNMHNVGKATILLKHNVIWKIHTHTQEKWGGNTVLACSTWWNAFSSYAVKRGMVRRQQSGTVVTVAARKLPALLYFTQCFWCTSSQTRNTLTSLKQAGASRPGCTVQACGGWTSAS